MFEKTWTDVMCGLLDYPLRACGIAITDVTLIECLKVQLCPLAQVVSIVGRGWVGHRLVRARIQVA